MPEQDKSNLEPAEGSRETANVNPGADNGSRERFDTEQAQRGKRGKAAAGITNRPLDEEIENQSELPLRGSARDDENVEPVRSPEDVNATPPHGDALAHGRRDAGPGMRDQTEGKK